MKTKYEPYTAESIRKEGTAWLIFGSIWTVASIGIFIIFPIILQVKDLGVCLALGAFLVIMGPAFFLCVFSFILPLRHHCHQLAFLYQYGQRFAFLMHQ